MVSARGPPVTEATVTKRKQSEACSSRGSMEAATGGLPIHVQAGTSVVEQKGNGVEPFSDKAVNAYLTAPLLAEELKLLSDVRRECKGLKDTQWNFDLSHAHQKHLNAEYLKGLIKVVPLRGAGGKAGRYCVGWFAIQMYCKLLEERQQMCPTYCRHSVFLQPHDQARLNRVDVMAVVLADEFRKQDMGNVCNVFMPLFESVDEHWLLLVADLEHGKFEVYDSLSTTRPGVRAELIKCAKEVVAGTLSTFPNFTDAQQWVTEHASCPQQGNGHDCGVFLMVLMDLMSMRAEQVVFDPQHIRHVRDKLLLSLLHGKIAHFPDALIRAGQ